MVWYSMAMYYGIFDCIVMLLFCMA